MDTNPTVPNQQSRRKLSYAFLAVGCVLLVIAFLVGINDNPPAIVAMLAGFFAVILAIIYFFGKSSKRTPGQQLLYWAPRALCILFAALAGLFALDVFNEGQGVWGTALALLMHLVPTFLVLVVLALSWRREWIGGILFIALAVIYAVWSWNMPFGPSAIPLISGMLLLIGALFLLNWQYRGVLRGNST